MASRRNHAFDARASDTFVGLAPREGEDAATTSQDEGEQDRQSRRRATLSRLWVVFALCLIVVGPILAVVAWRLASNVERERLRAGFEEAVADRARDLEAQVLSYTESLHALRALYYSSENVTPEEFATFSGEARQRHASILAMGWAPKLSVGAAGDRPGASRDGDGHAARHPIEHVEPLAAHRLLRGVDLASLAGLGRTLGRAAAVETTVMSELVALPGDEGEVLSALLLLAVRSSPDARVADNGVRGVVFLAFRTAAAASESSRFGRRAATAGTHYDLEDVTPGAPPRRVHLSRAPPHDGEESVRAAQGISVGGREWILHGDTTWAALSVRRGAGPWWVAAGIFLLWELFAGFLLVLARYWRAHALGRQARLVHSVLRSLGEGVVVSDRRGDVRMMNESARRLVGGSRPEIARRRLDLSGLFRRPDGLTPYAREHLPFARAMRGETVEEEAVIRRFQGSDPVHVSINAQPLMDEWNTMQGSVVVLQDITARKRSEEELRRLSSAVEQSADAIFITDSHGTMQYVNPAFEVTTGYRREEAVGLTPRLLKSDRHDPAHYESLWQTVLGGEVFRGTIVNRKKSGELYHAEQTITPMKDAGGQITHFVAVCKDLTQHKRLEEQDIEMRMAAEVQERLYPRKAPSVRGFEVAGAVFPATATCGDYFDYIHTPEGRLVLAVGDVCGHGLGPALVMAETRAYVRSLLHGGADPAEVLRRTNEFLAHDLSDELFVTLLLVGIHPDTRVASYASAGHAPGYILDAQGELKATLSSTGVPLGMFEGSQYDFREGPTLVRGDVLVLITDGVLESKPPGGEMFEEEGLLEVVRAHRDESADAIVEHIHLAARTHVQGKAFLDDVTLVVCKATE